MSQVPRTPYITAGFSTQTDLSGNQFYAGVLSSSLIVLASSKGAACDGIIMEKVKGSTDEGAIQLAISGICRAKIGDTVSEGNYLITDTDGTLIPDDAADQFVVAQALEDGVDGDIIAVRLILAPTTTS